MPVRVSRGIPQLRRGEVVRIRGERWRIVRHADYGTSAVVDAAGCDATNRAAHARFVLPFEPFARLPAWSAPRVVTPARWRRVARDALAEAHPSWTSLRAATRANLTLIPFQLEPALALARGEACRLLIADAVGLGKTVQAGLLIAETLARRPDARAIVISPAGLREQWREELRTRFHLEAGILDAAALARLAAQLPADVNPWAVERLAITSIDYIKRPEIMRALEALSWDVVVFDEAHNVAGRSDRAAAAAMLAQRARALVMLTATPHSGDDEAFGRLCSLGSLGSGDRLVMFRRSRADAGLAGSRRARLLRVRPTPAELVMHEALAAYAQLVWAQSAEAGARLALSVLARRACSSAGSLARSVERRLALLAESGELDAVQGDLPFAEADGDDDEPDALLRLPALHDAADERRHLERLVVLARAAARAESKVSALRRLIARTNEPAIVFTEYRDTLRRVAAALDEVEAVQLHGGLTPRERADALRRFTNGGARLLLATDAGSEGLNLHHRCRLVINLELPWTPLRLEQRAGRVDRIGQPRRVHIVHLVAAGTCEESTLARLVRRLHRLRSTMSLFARLPNERQVADSVFGHQSLPDLDDTPAAVPRDVVTLDLRREACAEALRIGLARAFSAPGSARDEGRPVIARVCRRRGRRPASRCFWVFKLAFVTASGHLVWESLVPFTADLRGTTVRSAALTRTVLSTDHPAFEILLQRTRDERLDALRPSLREALHQWLGRERGLMGALRARHARLSAELVQRSLFDRRDERRAASQALLLDEALSRSEIRLAELAEYADLRMDACTLVFGVILE